MVAASAEDAHGRVIYRPVDLVHVGFTALLNLYIYWYLNKISHNPVNRSITG